jgi:hypothetical protein
VRYYCCGTAQIELPGGDTDAFYVDPPSPES